MRPLGPRLLVVALLSVLPATARSQALQLQGLQFPPTSVVGPWVTYRVTTQSRTMAPRQYTQRVAIVARDSYRGRDGFWVELKTEGLPSGKRIERGFFVISGSTRERERPEDESAETPQDSLPPPPSGVRFVRYQVLTSGGKLYEYPVSSGSEARTGSEVSTMELFEYDRSIPPLVEHLGPDTLRIGRRVVPAMVERTRRYGSDEWPVPGDRGYVNRPVLTQTFWRNAAVPITGFARSLFQVTMERVPAEDSTATSTPSPADSARHEARDRVPRAAADSAGGGPAPFFTKTELELVDLGADAVPEVTQAPEDSAPPGGPSPGILR